jgi:hypothetical protein
VPFLRHFTAAFKADHKHSSLSTALVFPYSGAAEPSSWCRYRGPHSLGTPGQRLNDEERWSAPLGPIAGEHWTSNWQVF